MERSRLFTFSQLRLSISMRLTLWYGLTLLILLSLFAVFCYTNFHVSLHRDFDRHLTHEKRELLPFVQLGEAQLAFASLNDLRSVAYQTDGIYGTYVRLISAQGDELYRSPNFQGHPTLPVRLPDDAREMTISRNWEGKPARTRYAPLVEQGGALKGWLEVTGFEWSLHQELARLGRVLIFGIVLSVLLAIAGGFLLARRALRPVSALTEAANEIKAADLSARLPTHFGVRDELTDLAETFNGMIERLEASFNRERRFSSNAAHELLTPLTNMRNSVDVALLRDRDVAKYKKTLRTILVDVDEMSEKVGGLLQLSQAERLAELPRRPVDLSQMSREHAERFQERAAAQEIQLQLCVESAIFVMGDTARLGEVFVNLIDNALKYTPKEGHITLEVEGDEHEARLRVSDTGIGFSPDQAEHLFDRFYRADTSMVQAQAGSGLGLTVVQTIVHAYGGTLSAQSRGPGQGSTFEVRFPRTDASRVA